MRYLPFVVALGCCACQRGGTDEPVAGELCAMARMATSEAAAMRASALASYEASAEDFDLDRRWRAGELGSSDASGKLASAQRRGWQDAYIGDTWCRASERVDAFAVSAVRRVQPDSPAERAFVEASQLACASLDVFDRLITHDPAKARAFLNDARAGFARRTERAQALLAACRAAASEP